MADDDQLNSSTEDDACCLSGEVRRFVQRCRDLPGDTSECVEKVRDTTVGQIVDGTLEVIRKKPGVGVLAAVAVGFCLGRVFRR